MSTPADSWTIAPPLAPTDWDVYVTGDYVSDVVPDGDVLWVASSGGLLRWERPSRRLTHLDSLSLIGFRREDAAIEEGLAWFAAHQEADGLWPTGYGKGAQGAADRLWVGLAVCRVLQRFLA